MSGKEDEWLQRLKLRDDCIARMEADARAVQRSGAVDMSRDDEGFDSIQQPIMMARRCMSGHDVGLRNFDESSDEDEKPRRS